MEPMPSFHPMITVMVSSSCVTSEMQRFHREKTGVALVAFKAFKGWCTYTKTQGESSKMMTTFFLKPNMTFLYRKIWISWMLKYLGLPCRNILCIRQHHHNSIMYKNVGSSSDTVAQCISCHSHSTTYSSVFEDTPSWKIYCQPTVWSSWVSLKSGLFFGTACHWRGLAQDYAMMLETRKTSPGNSSVLLLKTRKWRERGA